MRRVRTRKRGRTWSYAFEAGRTEDGKRHVIERGGYATRDEAYAAGAEAYTDWQHGNIGITDEHITLRAYLESWLENVSRPSVKTSTYGNYKSVIKRIPASLGSMRLTDLTPAQLDAWLRHMVKQDFTRTTIRLTFTILREALSYAVYPAELIRSNPADHVRVPKTDGGHHVERKIIPAAEFAALIEQARDTDYFVPLLLLYHTGMRIGEVCGLMWNDVDLQHNELHVTQQLQHEEQQYCIGTPKTATSIRSIKLDAELVNTLSLWWVAQQENEARLGKSYLYNYRTSDSSIVCQSRGLHPSEDWCFLDLVCTRKNGRALHPEAVSRYLSRFGYNAHSFRHTHATLLIENGASLKGVAARLGHASVAITSDLYTHETEKMSQDTVDIFEQYMQTNAKCRQNADKKSREP